MSSPIDGIGEKCEAEVELRKPSKMSSEELWFYLTHGNFVPNWALDNQKKRIDDYNRSKRIARRSAKIGEFLGFITVLIIHSVLFYFISKLIYPLTFIQSVAVVLLCVCIGKIFSMPMIRYFGSNDNG